MCDVLFSETALPHRHPPLLGADYAELLTLLLEEKIGERSVWPRLALHLDESGVAIDFVKSFDLSLPQE